ncbi:hypothetical protein HPB50_011018 [Hyalomma asiaticum]|uniref:Uncharacterized protein n=1 Tax=Hyalomma asiaticum TaxID=266040 RepID=A0ACB7TGC0_HYAAI|nr:hypothetical protein HPB50_011018 [Hyalomma asiaticum]
MPQANQVQAQLEDGGEPSWLSWLRSPTQVLLFLVSGLLHFVMGLIVTRTLLMSHSNDGEFCGTVVENWRTLTLNWRTMLELDKKLFRADIKAFR